MPKRKTLKFFFWDKKLYRTVRIIRPSNLVEAWWFSERKSVTLLYSDFKSHAEVAVQTGTAAEIMQCTPQALMRYVYGGHIHYPEHSYALDGKYGEAEQKEWYRTKYKYWWGEHNLLELHDYLMTIRRGWPRKDGGPTPLQRTPSKAEIHAIFNNSPTLYVKGIEGDYIPIFRQPTW